MLLAQVYPGHAARSGYAMLASAMGDAECVKVEPESSSLLPRSLTWLSRRLSETRWSNWAGLRMQAAALRKMLWRRDGGLYHLLYGETGFAWAAAMAQVTGHKTVATFHLPPSLLSDVLIRPESLNRLDGVILVGSSQRSWFADRMRDSSRICVIPHGVDVDYFAPVPRAPRSYVTCLAVGSFHRNYDLLAKVARSLLEEPRVRFTVVSPREAARPLAGLPNVTVMERLNDKELRDLYRCADLFVLPVRDTTANNALLEAIACGVPVVAEDVGSIRDYVGCDNAVLCPPDSDVAMSRAIRELIANPDYCYRMGEASRRRAVALRWSNVAEQTRAAYCRAECGANRKKSRPPSSSVSLDGHPMTLAQETKG